MPHAIYSVYQLTEFDRLCVQSWFQTSTAIGSSAFQYVVRRVVALLVVDGAGALEETAHA